MASRITAVQRALALFSRKYRHASFRDIAQECGISKSSAARICQHKPTSQKHVDSVVEKASTRGRPREVSDRSVRKLIRTLKDMQSRNLNITVKNVIEKSGLSLEMASRRTFSRYLNEEGYSYLQARKKGLLSENDRK